MSQPKPNTASEMAHRRQFIKSMTKEAFQCYHQFAWGEYAVCPVEKIPFDYLQNKHSGWTLVSAMSTLAIMELNEEFELGKEWIEKELNWSQIDEAVIVFDAVSDIIGSLLSCYALTKDQLFIDKAQKIADVLEPTYQTPTGLPYLYLNPYDSNIKEYNTSKLFAPTLEYAYLSQLTNDTKYVDRANKAQKLLKDIEKPHGLYMDWVNIDTGKFASKKTSLFYDTRQVFINMIKSYIQSNGNDPGSLEMYKAAMDAIDTNGLFATNELGSLYTGLLDLDIGQVQHSMDADAAYFCGILALGAEAMKRSIDNNAKQVEMQRIERHWQLARDLADTFYRVSKRTKTGLIPSSIFMNKEHEDNGKFIECVGYFLNSELAESYFTLWRLTKDVKYRDYAWEMTQSIYSHCRVQESGGYSNIADVDEVPAEKLDLQSPAFLGSTLKYLYLTFCDDEQLPFDKWVFNAAGHPLPIFDKEKC